jgi:uncharacterized membrane protein
VDRAYHLGYEAGREHWQRVAVVAFVFGLLALARRKRENSLVTLAVVYGLVVIAAVALVALPLVALFLIVRAIVRHSRTQKAEWQLDDGSVF